MGKSEVKFRGPSNINVFHAFLLGLIRGMTEFNPVSSIAYFTSLEWIDKMEN